jgi:hypothetical protein
MNFGLRRGIIFSVKLLDPEDDGTAILRNVGNYVTVDMT